MELEITPEPTEEEREAIVAALTSELEPPYAYRSPWRRDDEDEPFVAPET